MVDEVCNSTTWRLRQENGMNSSTYYLGESTKYKNTQGHPFHRCWVIFMPLEDSALPRRLVRPLAVSLRTSSCSHHPGANKDFLFKTPEVTTEAGRLGVKDPRREAAMSDMVERTLTALPGLFLQNQLGGPAASRAPFFSRLGGLIRGVTALSSKHVGRQGGVGWAGPEAPVS